MLDTKVLTRVLEEEELKARCLKAWICPDCGAKLRDVGGPEYIEPGCLSKECSSIGTRKRFVLFGKFESYKIPKTQW